jgi:hypothetical protein
MVRGALTEITTHARKVSELMSEISAASQEQAQGVDQVNKAMYSNTPHLNIALADKADKKTKVVSPEDVIPLEKDPYHFLL